MDHAVIEGHDNGEIGLLDNAVDAERSILSLNGILAHAHPAVFVDDARGRGLVLDPRATRSRSRLPYSDACPGPACGRRGVRWRAAPGGPAVAAPPACRGP